MRRSPSSVPKAFVQVAVASALALSLAAGGAAATKWRGTSPMLGGVARHDAGEWIYQDFVYDDYGADTAAVSSFNVVSLAPTSGDFRYPDDPQRYANNAADVVEVRVRIGAAGRRGPATGSVEIRVTLNTLLDADSTVLGVGIDHGSGTKKPWPGKAGVSSVWDQFLTVAAGSVWDAAGKLVGQAATDLAANTVTFTIPGGAEGDSVILTLGAGLWDATTGEWLRGAPAIADRSGGEFDSGGPTDVRVFDLAFNSRALEPRGGNWQEDAQSEALASADVSAFVEQVDLARLRSGASDGPILEPGHYDRLFVSRQDLGEGVDPAAFPQFRGKLQPYSLWLPTGYDPSEPTPLVLLLHSLDVHHNQYSGEPTFDTMYEQLDPLGALVVTPLARGPDGWYWDEGLVDTLEAWDDVRAHYNVDEERTSTTGYSMGGYGTYRLLTLMPDRFAAAVSWVGPPAHQLWAFPLDPVPPGPRQAPGNTWFQLENVEHVPIYIVHGTNDELVPVTGVEHQAERLRELGYEHRFDLHPGLDHFALTFLDEWSRERDWLQDRARTRNPGHVIFKVRPASWVTSNRPARERRELLSHLEALVGLFDSAYWVDDVVVADGDDVTGTVDLESEGIAARVPVATDAEAAFPGPPTPFVRQETLRTIGLAATANALRGSLTGVSELTVDLAAAGLRLDPTLVVDVTTDQPETRLHLVDGPASEVRILP